MSDEKKYPHGFHPNSRANLRPRQKGSGKPTRERYRRDLIADYRKRGWQGDEKSEDFELLMECKYELRHVARTSLEKARLRDLILRLARDLGLDSASNKAKEGRVEPVRTVERSLRVAAILGSVGALGELSPEQERGIELIDAGREELRRRQGEDGEEAAYEVVPLDEELEQ